MKRIGLSAGVLVAGLVWEAGGEVRYRIVPIYPPPGITPWSMVGLDINNRGGDRRELFLPP